MRLIDADALIADSCRDCPEELRKRCKTEPACADTKFLFEIPTVDAVPVVRCKDCKNLERENARWSRIIRGFPQIQMIFAVTENGGTMIKDSGERTKFPSGALRDMHTGKGRMDLLPWSAIMEVSKHCEAGALKYGEHNVDKGIPTHSLLDSAIRHAAKYLAGYVDEPHLVAAAWNLLWAIEMEIVHTECVDTPWRASDGE